MILTWRAKRQLVYFSIFSAIVLLIIAGLISFFREGPTCTDNVRNQNEEGVDCGGPCAPCLGNVKELVSLWTRYIEVGPSRYDVAALFENPNSFAASSIVHYSVKLHDKNNILIALRGGVTFINPNERFVIFESNIETANRIPVQASVEFEPIEWKRFDVPKPIITSFGYTVTNNPTGRLEITARNDDIFPVRNLEAAVVLLDDKQNAIGVSRTRIDAVDGESQRQIGFTWPYAFNEDPDSIQVFIRKIPDAFLDAGY